MGEKTRSGLLFGMGVGGVKKMPETVTESNYGGYLCIKFPTASAEVISSSRKKVRFCEGTKNISYFWRTTFILTPKIGQMSCIKRFFLIPYN